MTLEFRKSETTLLEEKFLLVLKQKLQLKHRQYEVSKTVLKYNFSKRLLKQMNIFNM